MKEIKEDTNRWRDIPCSWTGGINIVNMTKLHKAIQRVNAISIKLPMTFLTEVEKHSTIFMETKKAPDRQSNLEKEKWNWRNRLSDFRLYYNATVIKTVWY